MGHTSNAMKNKTPVWVKVVGWLEIIVGARFLLLGIWLVSLDLRNPYGGFGILYGALGILVGLPYLIAGILFLKSKMAGKIMTVVIGLQLIFSMVRPIVSPLIRYPSKSTDYALIKSISTLPLVKSAEIKRNLTPGYGGEYNVIAYCDREVLYDEVRSDKILNQMSQFTKSIDPKIKNIFYVEIIVRAKNEKNCYDEKRLSLKKDLRNNWIEPVKGPVEPGDCSDKENKH